MIMMMMLYDEEDDHNDMMIMMHRYIIIPDEYSRLPPTAPTPSMLLPLLPLIVWMREGLHGEVKDELFMALMCS